jgi:hypothetical protein
MNLKSGWDIATVGVVQLGLKAVIKVGLVARLVARLAVDVYRVSHWFRSWKLGDEQERASPGGESDYKLVEAMAWRDAMISQRRALQLYIRKAALRL